MTFDNIVTALKSRTEAEQPIRQRSRGFQHQAHVPTVNLATSSTNLVQEVAKAHPHYH